MVQFLKNGRSGEIKILQKLENVNVITGQINKFSIDMTEAEKQRAARLHEKYFSQAVSSANRDGIDLLVLDEVLGAIETGLLPESVVIDFLEHKPGGLEVVLTGRKASTGIMDLADYISQINAVKHPFDQGVPARRGIEF